MAGKKDDGIKCSKCGGIKKEGEYYMSKSDIYTATGRLGVCKNCMQDIYNLYLTKYDNEELAIYYMCRKLDICFNLSSFNASQQEKSKGKKTEIWQIYMTKLNSLGSKNGAGETFDDSDALDKEDIQLKGLQDNISDEVIQFWGKGFVQDEYEFLEKEYMTLCDRFECDSYSQEMLFQEISQVRLDIKKKRQQGLNVDKELKTLQDLLGSANIKPVQETGANATEQATFGTLVKKWENEKPIPEPLEEWEKNDWIKKYVIVWFLGHLCKMMGVKNQFSDMYDDEIGQYTVDLDDEENSNSETESEPKQEGDN